MSKPSNVEPQAQDAVELEKIAAKYGLPPITVWKQGRFIDSPKYSHMSEDWRQEQQQRERTLIRPNGGTNNALFQIAGSSDNAAIASYLEEVGKYLASINRLLTSARLDSAIEELSCISPAVRRDKDGKLLGSVGGRIAELKKDLDGRS